MEAIQEGIQVNKDSIKRTEEIIKSLEEKKEEILADESMELLYDITHPADPPKSKKLGKLLEQGPPQGGEYFFVPFGGLGNKNQTLAIILYYTTPMDTEKAPSSEYDSEAKRNADITATKVQIEYGHSTVEEVYEYTLQRQKDNIEGFKKANEIIEELSKEKKNYIPELDENQKTAVKEVLEINKKNIEKLNAAITELEGEKEAIISSGDNKKIYESLEGITKMDNTKFAELVKGFADKYDNIKPASLDIIDQMTMTYDIEGFGLDRSRLAKAMEYSFSYTNNAYRFSKEGIEENGNPIPDGEIDKDLETVLDYYSKFKTNLEEYNKVLENALEGKNYLIDNIYYYTGDLNQEEE